MLVVSGRSALARAYEVDLAMDARAHLNTLVGKSIHTIGQGRPNRIVTLDGADVVVATTQSPNGKRSQLPRSRRRWTCSSGDLLIDKKIVGYRSALIGAVLAMLPRPSWPPGHGASASNAAERRRSG